MSQTMSLDVKIPYDGVELSGRLRIPKDVKGMIVFAHGSGSSRFSPRNQMVAHYLEAGDLATLLFDLLTPEEEFVDEKTREFRFDIPFLAKRLVAVVKWLEKEELTKNLNIGFFGASTGGGAAIYAASELRDDKKIKAVVSRGGRPDLAGNHLETCKTPTLLVVGGRDPVVIDLNKKAMETLGSREKEINIVAGATHLFEEEGTLEEVAKLAHHWFKRFL